jgi:hypothetical protein
MFGWIEKIRVFLSGKKTYLTAAGLIIAAVIVFADGGSISVLVKAILEALALIGIRLGISKN